MRSLKILEPCYYIAIREISNITNQKIQSMTSTNLNGNILENLSNFLYYIKRDNEIPKA